MTMKIQSANGTEGCLLISNNNVYFRVYNPDKSFTDYRLRHTDLFVKIDDNDAFFYQLPDGSTTLDHSPDTLGMDLN